MSSEQTERLSHYLFERSKALLGVIPTYSTAPPVPNPPVVSTLNSCPDLDEFAVTVKSEFGDVAELPDGLVVEDFIGNTLFGQVYRGKVIKRRGLDNIQEANVMVKTWNDSGGKFRFYAKPPHMMKPIHDERSKRLASISPDVFNWSWRKTALGRFYDEMKLLKAAPLSSHDNMVKLIGSGLVNGRLAVVYELDPLDTLRNLLPRGWDELDIKKISTGENSIKGKKESFVWGEPPQLITIDPSSTCRAFLYLFIDDFEWFFRIEVAIRFASLIEAFHSEQFKLRNICADNLVLDQDFHLKLVDFGLLIGGDFGKIPPYEKVSQCTGYEDPYFYSTGTFLDKSDVFSYGVLLLELVTKRTAILQDEPVHLHMQATSEYETMCHKAYHPRRKRDCRGVRKHESPSLVHENLTSSAMFDANDGAKITKLALRCVRREPDRRPTIKEVVECLRQLEVAKRMGL